MEGTEPSSAFFEELGSAFRRLRPQGSHWWNFGGSFRRLETVVHRGVRLAGTAPGRTPGTEGADGGPSPSGQGPAAEGQGASRRELARAHLDRAVARVMAGRLDVAARRVVDDMVGPPLVDVHEALDATTEAFRFLAARVDALEEAAARRRAPVEGMAWLLPTPDLSAWSSRVVRWLADAGLGAAGGGVSGPGARSASTEEVLVGECGDGTLPGALASAGVRVRAAEPRGTVAWEAASRGVDVHFGPVAELVASRPADSVAALVLAGVVDRSPIEDVLDLLAVAADRLAPGAPLVVIGASPSAWGPVALDLLPGRPLHPATWSLLLERHGFTEIGSESAGDAYAVRARR